MNQQRKLTPKTHMLKSIWAKNWPLEKPIKELVDNSLGHGKATHVDISISNTNGISVFDDGIGMDDINRLFCEGDTSAYDDLTEIGQYGIGATEASIFLGRQVYAETARDGRHHQMSVDWEDVDASGEWPNAYTGQGTPAGNLHGTRIFMLKPHRHYQLTSSERLARELGFVFSPALRNGTMIGVRHLLKNGQSQSIVVAPFTPSDLINEHAISGEVRTSRGVLRWTGRAGLSASLTDRYNGVHIAFAHRVIETTREPFKGESAPTLYCEVYLDATTPWKHALSAYKDKVVRHRDELIDSIHAQIAPLVEQSTQQATYLQLHSMKAPIEAKLTKALRGAGVLHVDPDEEPEDGGEHGKSDNHVTPGKRLRTPTDDGDPARTANKPTGIQIEWVSPEYLDGKTYAWEISGKQIILSLDAEEHKDTIGWPPRQRERHVIQIIAAYLGHSLEMEYWNNLDGLNKAITSKLRSDLDLWAGEPNMIAPYMTHMILQGSPH